jgi:ribosomal subunit interface protein
MRISIQAKTVKASDTVRTYAEKRVARALDHHAELVKSVHVRLRDVNGKRGGVDQVCSIEVGLARLRPIVAESTQRTLRLAVDEACERLERALLRALAGRREKRRSPPRKPAARKRPALE